MKITCKSAVPSFRRQRGITTVVVLLLLTLLISTLVIGFTNDLSEQNKKNQHTADALAQAKEALIGYAAAVDLTGVGQPRPGDMPCPDTNNDGMSDNPCPGAALGRLPWKTLGLPDLRDADGERLWYAVSLNFKDNPRTGCTAPGQPGCLNSDARGTITIRDNKGTVINDGNMATGVVAVVLAPGSVLTRQGTAAAQDRSCTLGVNCDATEKCTTSPPSLTPRCNPINYLDVLSGVEDNADFVDNSSTNGFTTGGARDSNNNVIVNDRLLTITYQNVMPLLERRVAKEAFNCLTNYAAQNGGRYPWAADMTDSSTGNHKDNNIAHSRFGRIPDPPFNETALGLIGPPQSSAICTTLPAACMRTAWPSSCKITSGTWWVNWKDLVLYGVADAYKPAFPLINIPPPLFTLAAPAPSCGSCLTVNTVAKKQVVVIVAGKALTSVGQTRSSIAAKSLPANYVEKDNDWIAGPPYSPDGFNQQRPTSTFNDTLLYQ